MLILAIDFETTGLDTNTLHVTEVGAVLWDTERSKPVKVMNELVQLPDGQEIPEEIVKLNGITTLDTKLYGWDSRSVFTALRRAADRADCLMAHNALGFDKLIYDRYLVLTDQPKCEKTWIDTSVDIPYPTAISTRKLTHLAAEHKFLNPFAHRAVFDVMTMLQVASHYDLVVVLEEAKKPKVRVQAIVSFDEREKAKARGYRWDGVNRAWWKIMSDDKVETEIREATFTVKRMA